MSYTNQVKRDWLEDILPSGPSMWLGLLHKLPDAEGAGAIEAALARVEIDTWLTQTHGEFTISRSNTLLVQFPALTAWVEDVVGWAIFDSATLGVMKAFNRFRGSVLYTFPPLEEPRFQPGEIMLILDPAPVIVPGVTPDMETCVEFTTTDDTPTIQVLGTIGDEEAKHVDATVVGTGYDGAEGKHYYRQIFYSFERNDGGSGLGTWHVRDLTPDGGETRRGGLVTATAVMDDDGVDKVRITVTGELATTINWRICWKGIE